MDSIKNEVLYGVSVDGLKPCSWDKEYPDESEIFRYLNLERLYKSVEIVEKNVSYQVVKKVR